MFLRTIGWIITLCLMLLLVCVGAALFPFIISVLFVLGVYRWYRDYDEIIPLDLDIGRIRDQIQDALGL